MDGLPVILRGEEMRDGMPLVVRHHRRHGGAVIAMMVGAAGGWIIMTIGMGLSPEAKGTMRYRNANANQNNPPDVPSLLPSLTPRVTARVAPNRVARMPRMPEMRGRWTTVGLRPIGGLSPVASPAPQTGEIEIGVGPSPAEGVATQCEPNPGTGLSPNVLKTTLLGGSLSLPSV